MNNTFKKFIKIKGARENNLKNIDILIPRNQFIVLTGVSGSGKSTIAFDIIYAEGMRRYTESLSMYARQFINQMKKPDIDHIEGLSPTICIEQKTTFSNPRSTVGTITEIYPLLKLLFFQCSDWLCPKCNTYMEGKSIYQIFDKNFNPTPSFIKSSSEDITVFILTYKKSIQKKDIRLEIDKIKQLGYKRIKINKQIILIEEWISKIDQNQNSFDISIIIDRFPLKYILKEKILNSLEKAYKVSKELSGNSILCIDFLNSKNKTFLEKIYCEEIYCIKCNLKAENVELNHFSFNSPYGACSKCLGIGKKVSFDPNLIIPDKSISIKLGGIKTISINNVWYKMQFESLSNYYDFDLIHTPIENIPQTILNDILYGTKKEIEFEYINRNKIKVKKNIPFEGIIPMMERKYHENKYPILIKEYKKYLMEQTCYACKGKRLKKEILSFKINFLSITDVFSLSLEEAENFVKNIKYSSIKKKQIGEKIIQEVENRLKFLNNLGLGYLSFDRSAETLSGGELQRIRLGSQIGSKLMGILYILDEPSIGLHERDNEKLIDSLKMIRDLDNTLIIVEHDKRTILQSDYVLDIGPYAGINGGKIIAQGTPNEIIQDTKSITGKYLSGKKKIQIKKNRDSMISSEENQIQFINCHKNNLKNIDIHIPLNQFIVITGVSGSGKSTLMNDIIYNSIRYNETIGFSKIIGRNHIGNVILIDQSPIGRTNRSIPVTYTSIFNDIRFFFSNMENSKIEGFKPSHFSFNCKEGQCKNCKGDGVLQIQMVFLANVYITCEVCQGARYNSKSLAIKYREKSISDILDMSFKEAFTFFENIPYIKKKLKIFLDVGLEYLKLGQRSTTLSGGEAQRIKLAKELMIERTKTLYLLDEPTTGLHFHDIQNLLVIIEKIIENKNTVICIEHNLDLIRNADYIIDLGPEGGNKGGEVIFQGKLEGIMNIKKSYTGKYLKN